MSLTFISRFRKFIATQSTYSSSPISGAKNRLLNRLRGVKTSPQKLSERPSIYTGNQALPNKSNDTSTVNSSLKNILCVKQEPPVKQPEGKFTLPVSDNEKIMPGFSIIKSADKIRTIPQCLIDLTALIKKSAMEGKDKKQILDRLKYYYLAGGLYKEKNASFKEKIMKLLRDSCTSTDAKNGLPEKDIAMMLNTLERNFNFTRHNDNYYGRLFDSCLANYIVENPSEEMIRATEVIKNDMLHDAQQYSYYAPIYHNIAHDIRGDFSPWRDTIPEVAHFLYNPNFDTFSDMLNSPHSYSPINCLHIAAKYLKYAPSKHELMENCSRSYLKKIIPFRHYKAGVCNQASSNYVGILLKHQMYEDASSFIVNGEGVRPIDDMITTTKKVSKPNRIALLNGNPVVVGISGNAHMLGYYFSDLKSKTEFDIEQAKLLTAAMLTFSGGHSINEAYLSYQLSAPKKGEPYRPVNYNQLSEIPVAKKAIDDAYEKLLSKAVAFNS